MSLCPFGFSDKYTDLAVHLASGWLQDCPNMLEREGDTSMEYEHYECKVCGRTTKLDYEEMR